MKLLNLDYAEENLLHWLAQCCLSDNLLLKERHPADLDQHVAPVRTLNAKLMEIGARSGRPAYRPAGERLASGGAWVSSMDAASRSRGRERRGNRGISAR